MKIIFLPGMLCDERVWKGVANELSDYFETIILDLRQQSSLTQMICDIQSNISEDTVLVGFSMGGYVAQEYAVRFASKLSGLVLVSVSGDGFTDKEKKKHLDGKSLALKGEFEGLTDVRIRELLCPATVGNEKLIDLIKNMASKNSSKVYLNQLSATYERRDLKKELSALGLKVAIIGGYEDKIVPHQKLKELSLNIPNSDIHLIEKCGHFAPLEQTKKLANIIDNFAKLLS